MSSDDSFRNSQYSSNRKPGSKTHVYSPSANYNFNSSQPMHGNHNGNHGNHNGNGNYGNQQQRRKNTNFKPRDNHGSNDRIIKQNDIIIRLLKEIRDRLPPNPSAPSYEKHDNVRNRKYTGKHTSSRPERSETDTDERNETEDETACDEMYVEEESVQDDVAAETDDSEPVENELEELDNAVNGNLR